MSINNNHVRLRDVNKDKEPFQSKTKYGLHKRAFTDEFQFKVDGPLWPSYGSLKDPYGPLWTLMGPFWILKDTYGSYIGPLY